MTRARFTIIETRQYTDAEGEQANAKARLLRENDLNEYGSDCYTLLSTVTVPLHDGLRIIDTMTLVLED